MDAERKAAKASRKAARVNTGAGDDARAKRSKGQQCRLNSRTTAPLADVAAAAAYFEKHEIVVDKDDAPPPCLSLAAAPFSAPLVAKLLTQPGFDAPSAVQATAWPIAAAGRDVLAIAKTGSGKTLGFLLPVLQRCHLNRGTQGAPQCLIMAPTRELALQIAAEATKFGASVGCRAVAVYGGASKYAQVRALRRGCDVVIGTPGRVMDVLDVRGHGAAACASVTHLSMLVLDEADRMLDLGFERDIRSLAWHAFGERQRQTFLFSATWPEAVRGVAGDLLTHRPVKVTVGSGGRKLTANRSVTQRVHVVDGTEAGRLGAFAGLIAPFGPGGALVGHRVIVFANMKVTVAKLLAHCQAKGMAVGSISGDRSQSQRESTIRKFKEGRAVTVVVATDVAARGLDIKGVARVINYELPVDDFQDYVHRIGRTGRAGESGEADSLFSSGDRANAPTLIQILKEAGQALPNFRHSGLFLPATRTRTDKKLLSKNESRGIFRGFVARRGVVPQGPLLLLFHLELYARREFLG